MSQPDYQLQETIENTSIDTEIVIIDDDMVFSSMLQDYLLSAEHLKSETFSNGNDFLKNYKSNDERKIILDYEFDKGPDGLMILEKIVKINPMAKVIIVSAQDNLEKAVETLRKGASDYFVKTNKTVFANVLCSLKKLRELEKLKLN